MNQDVLILIDIQNMYFAEGAYQLHEPEKAAEKAAILLKKFREEQKPVIHVMHRFPVGDQAEGRYLLGFNEAVLPQAGETIIEKDYPSAFLQTGLKETLDTLHAETLVIAGMMTHMCIDTTVRAAQNYDYKITVIDDACTTKDLVWKGETIDAKTVHNSIMASLQGTFATVMGIDKFLQQK